MLRNGVLALAFIALLTIAAASLRLGPRDEVQLAPTDLERVKVGDKAPDFTLENRDGTRISLSDFAGKKNVVLVFYRGHW